MITRIVVAFVVSLLAGVAIACGDSTPSPTPTPLPTVVEPTSQPTVAAASVVTGTVTYRERIALGPQTVLEVKLVDISRADAPAVTIGEQIIEGLGQVPIPFEIQYDPATIDDRFTYAVQARIIEGTKLLFINDTQYNVITRGNPFQVDLVLVKVGETKGPSEKSDTNTAVFEVGPCRVTRAAPLPIELEYLGTIPTGFDGINMATCTFTKPVKTVEVVLTGPATHSEIFTLSEATTEVSFPLPEGTLSISTLEIVPPGEYQREMTVTSVDGETLVISDQPGVLKTVTILEP